MAGALASGRQLEWTTVRAAAHREWALAHTWNAPNGRFRWFGTPAPPLQGLGAQPTLTPSLSCSAPTSTPPPPRATVAARAPALRLPLASSGPRSGPVPLHPLSQPVAWHEPTTLDRHQSKALTGFPLSAFAAFGPSDFEQEAPDRAGECAIQDSPFNSDRTELTLQRCHPGPRSGISIRMRMLVGERLGRTPRAS